MTSSHRWLRGAVLALALLGATGATSTASAADSSAVQQLLDNAEYWKQRGRNDKVIEIYEKILRSDPNHAQSLAELALLYAQDGQKDKAKGYLSRLEKADPSNAKIRTIRQALDLGGTYKDLLSEARALAQAGSRDAAVGKYREMFGTSQPTGQVALEFYQTLGGTKTGWDEAKTGLERLHRENPANAKMSLALAQHLTYREPTRREGIHQLADLADDSTVGKQARSSWRQALIWLAANVSDANLYRSYLAKCGEDADVRHKLDVLGTQAAQEGSQAIVEGYGALNEGDVDRANEAFEWALKQRGRNVDAIVGMAIVELQRENFDQAEKLLLEAKRMAPTHPEKWERSLQSASFWRMVRQAQAAQDAGKYQDAATLLTQALQVSPGDAIHAQVALGNLYLATGDDERAADAFRQVLQSDPDNEGALVAMVTNQLRNGQLEAAMVFNDRLRQMGSEKVLPDERLRSEMMRHQAAYATSLGDFNQAEQVLTDAATIDPGNEWVLFDLLNAYLETGDVGNARETMDNLLRLAPDLPQFRLANARLLAEEGKYNDAIAVIESTRAEELSTDMTSLRRRLEVQIQATMAVRKATYEDDVGTARQILLGLQNEVDGEADLMSAVALGWSDLGDDDRAVSLATGAVDAATPRQRVGLQLSLAAILLRAHRDDQLQQLVASLDRDASLTARERRGLDGLKIAMTVQRADTLRDRGAYTAAYDLLQPLLKAHPEDPNLVNALGRIMYSSGDHAASQAVFERILADHPDDVEARQGAALAAIAQGKRDDVNRIIGEGLDAFPSDPRMYLVAGRIASMMRFDSKAMGHLNKAMALAESQEELSGGFRVTTFAGDGTVSSSSSYDDIVRNTGVRLKSVGSGDQPLDTTLRGEIQGEISQLQARHRIVIGADLNVRHRIGEAGLSRLTDISLPVYARFPTGFTGALSLQAALVYLDSGPLDLEIPTVYGRWGTFGVSFPFDGVPTTVADPQANAAGAALRLGWKYKGYGLWLGSTPLGFPVTTITGGFEIGHSWETVGFRLVGERKPVTDSLLSYAGLQDPVTSQVWGGVTANGARLDFSVTKKPILFYLYGGYEILLATNAPTNGRWQGGLGLQWALYRGPNATFATGLASNLQGFALNQRFFTYGHGGYFSPQVFVNAAIPLVLHGEAKKVTYDVDANIGVNWFREDVVPYYPTDDGLQGTREAFVDPETSEPVEYEYESRTVLSFALNANAKVAYQVTPAVLASLRLSLYTAREYTEIIAGLGVEYKFGAAAPRERVDIPRIVW